MRTIDHPFEPEELMAYLDGELPSHLAVRAAEHLGNCLECQQVAADLNGVSDRLREWHVEAPLLVAPQATVPPKKVEVTGRWGFRPLFGWGLAGIACGVPLAIGLYTMSSSRPQLQRSEMAQLQRGNLEPEPPPVPGRGIVSRSVSNRPHADEDTILKSAAEPLIANTARLTMVASNFDRSRDALQEILKRHHSYISQMTVNAEESSARSLEASIKIPAAQLDATIAEMKALGRVLSEVRAGEEVTQQSLDLDARLANARHTEQRLTDLLQHRTDKLADIMAVENQISETRGQIEQMEAERKNLTSRVVYSKLDVRITEEYKAQLDGARTSTSTRLRNAAVEGYRAVVSNLEDVFAGALANGPLVLVWCAILFFPVRFVWRRLARR